MHIAILTNLEDSDWARAIVKPIEAENHTVNFEIVYDGPGQIHPRHRGHLYVDVDLIFVVTSRGDTPKPENRPIQYTHLPGEHVPKIFILARGNFTPPWASEYPIVTSTNLGTTKDIIKSIIGLEQEAIGKRLESKKLDVEEKKQKLELIGTKATEYIEPAIKTLKSFESHSRGWGIAWYVFGFISLLAALWIAAHSVAFALANVQESWVYFAIVTLKSLGLILLLGVTCRYCFVLGQSYTCEAHKATNRLHAISFGRFYLEAYGANANWSEVKEAFADWNIDRGSAFDKVEPAAIDPKLPEGFLEALKVVMQAKAEK